jgi:hypothetical protein
MEPAEELSTLVHELAHEMLHKRERRMMTTKTIRETEAEAVAFVVCNALGLETGDASRDYIQLYHGNADLLQESLEVIKSTAVVILGAIGPPRPLDLKLVDACALTFEKRGDQNLNSRYSFSNSGCNSFNQAFTRLYSSTVSFDISVRSWSDTLPATS